LSGGAGGEGERGGDEGGEQLFHGGRIGSVANNREFVLQYAFAPSPK
jgi:hypothetical protein